MAGAVHLEARAHELVSMNIGLDPVDDANEKNISRMKKLISTLMVALGAAPVAAQAPGKIETINSKSIRFTMPTVATDDLKFVMPTAETFRGAPQFHEDEWAQVEFFPSTRLAEVQRRLVEYKAFEQSHRGPHGWTDIYARRVARSPVVGGTAAVEELASKVHGSRLPSPILTTSSKPLGQVEGGFSIRLNEKVHLYGLADRAGINVLAAILDRGADDTALTSAFLALRKSKEVILVDWRSQMVLVGSTSSGSLEVWRP